MNEKASSREEAEKTHSNYDIETANESATEFDSAQRNELQFCAQLMTFLFECKMVVRSHFQSHNQMILHFK